MVQCGNLCVPSASLQLYPILLGIITNCGCCTSPVSHCPIQRRKLDVCRVSRWFEEGHVVVAGEQPHQKPHLSIFLETFKRLVRRH